LSNDSVRAIHEDRAEPGVLWIGTEGGGLNRFDLKTNRFTHWQNNPNDPNNPDCLSNNSVRAIHQDQSGVLWLGTAGGFNKFDPKSNSFKRYLYDSTNPNSLSGNIVQSIYADPDGMLWLGTYGGGLSRFDPKTDQFTVYTENNSGLSNNAVYAALPDDHGNLWLSTNAGVCKFNPQLALTDFKLFDESVPIGGKSPLQKHISETDAITLAYWQNDVSFEFVALHYGRPENNEYAFRLENYDTDWRYAGTQRIATYTNLDPGAYLFRVKGSNNDAVWNKEGVTFVSTIAAMINSVYALRAWLAPMQAVLSRQDFTSELTLPETQQRIAQAPWLASCRVVRNKDLGKYVILISSECDC
jgi:hypothetical protein